MEVKEGISTRGKGDVIKQGMDGELRGMCGKQPVVWFG